MDSLGAKGKDHSPVKPDNSLDPHRDNQLVIKPRVAVQPVQLATS